jgi:hypothetical protein
MDGVLTCSPRRRPLVLPPTRALWIPALPDLLAPVPVDTFDVRFPAGPLAGAIASQLRDNPTEA